jgi:hypothetical protein
MVIAIKECLNKEKEMDKELTIIRRDKSIKEVGQMAE